MSKLAYTSMKFTDLNIGNGGVPQMNLGYCPYMDIKSPQGSYQTLTDGLVVPERRSHNENSAVPDSLPNGGLFNAPQSTEPWANIPVVPTELNLIHYNLRSANPPPGATEQYISNDRLGNNYAPRIGIYWYNPENGQGMYNIECTKKI